jgi:tetratricopeptide (TPR) repeat protein
MQKMLLVCSILFLLACNDTANENDNILEQPPFHSLSDSISKDPANAGLYYRRGTLLFSQGEKDLAGRDLRRAWDLLPNETHGLSLTTYLKEKNSDSAILFLEEAIKKLPRSIALKIGLARGYQQKKQNEKANSILDQILKEFPGQLDALSLKSEILGEMDQPAESLAYLERAQALVPSDPVLAYDLAYEYAIGKNGKVLRLTDSLIKTQTPEIEKAYYSRAVYFSKTGNSKEALLNFDAATKTNYNFLDAYHDKGELLYNLSNFDEAQRTFELGLKIAPSNAPFYFWLGKCQEARGFKQEAKANYQRAFSLDKTLVIAKEAADKL